MAVPMLHKRVIDSLIGQQGNSKFTRDFLSDQAIDMVKFEDDFLGRVIDDRWYTFKSATSGALPVVDIAESGTLTMVTGATSGEYSALGLGLHFYGENSAIMCAIIKIASIANAKIEVGFHDAVGTHGGTATDVGGVLVLATPTANATDGAYWVWDTDDTGNTYGASSAPGWQCFGVKNGTVATKAEPSNIGNYAAHAGPVAAKYDVLIVALNEADARFYRGEMQNASGTDLEKRVTITYDSGWKADFIRGTVALTPWVYVQNTTAASDTGTLDYVGAWQYRYAAA